MFWVHTRRGFLGSALSGFLACAVGMGSTAPASSTASPDGRGVRPFVIDCGPGRTGPALRLTREVRAEGGRAAVTLRVTNTGRVAAKGAGFAEDLSGIPGDRAVVDARATTGKLAYAKPRLRWTGDLAAGDSATISYAVPVPASAGRMSISTVDGDAGRTCRGTTTSSGDTAQAGEQARSSGAASPVTATEEDAGDTAATPAGDGKASDAAATGDGKTPDAAAGPALPDAKTGTARNTETGAEAGASGRNGGAEANAENRARAKAGGRAKTKAGKRAKAKAGKRAAARAKPGAKVDARAAARRAPIPFSLRYGDNFRGAITRAANAVVTCYPPAVADCVTRRNGTGNNNVAATFIDVDSDASTFNSSTADLTVSPGAQVAYARLYWGGRSQTTTDTPGLPAGNRFAPAIAQRGQVLIKAPGDSAYRTVTTDSTIGDTPDNVTAAGIVYGASADVTALVTAAGAGTYAVGNVQAARGSDGLGAFGGWTLSPTGTRPCRCGTSRCSTVSCSSRTALRTPRSPCPDSRPRPSERCTSTSGRSPSTVTTRSSATP